MKLAFQSTWERLRLYLPLVGMCLLALGTYWLVRSTPAVEDSQAAQAPTHEPDYFMQTFTVRTFDATGRLRTEVLGTKARHYPDTKWLEIDGIRIRSFDAKGRLTTATANQGLTNEDSSEVQLLGNALVVREARTDKTANAEPRMEYRSEFLHAFLTTEQVKSNKPVELLRGTDRFTADNLDYDNVEQILQLHGRVRGVLVPQAK